MKFNVDDLVEKGLVKKKTYKDGKYTGLSVLKYDRKVFYNNLWNLDSRLLDCRGMVVDSNDNIVCWPFTKVFNLNENGTTVDPDKIVIAPRKINGFMCAVTLYKGDLLFSTTGSLDSDYVQMAKDVVFGNINPDSSIEADLTYIFEICHLDDPHIVKEEERLWLIGIRNNLTGEMLDEKSLDVAAEWLGAYRPEVTISSFNNILNLSKTCKHEGFMIIDYQTGKTLCKLKSNHYLSKKAIMRLGKAKVEDMFVNPQNFKQRCDEEFYDLIDFIVETVDKEVWISYTDQQRRNFIENYFENC